MEGQFETTGFYTVRGVKTCEGTIEDYNLHYDAANHILTNPSNGKSTKMTNGLTFKKFMEITFRNHDVEFKPGTLKV